MVIFQQYQYYSFPEFNVFQPTFIYLTPVYTQNSYLPASSFEYEITDPHKRTPFTQTRYISSQINSLVKNQACSEEVNILNDLKTQRISQKKPTLKKSKNFAEVHIDVPSVQNQIIKKRKTTGQLFFGIEWKNQNRNIVPNIMNQMLSFIQKRTKSQQLIVKLFSKNSPKLEWTVHRYYCYVKRMKSHLGHYINENDLLTFTKLQQPQFLIYSEEQQLFYLKICRKAIDYFFRNESVLISLTSKRMSQERRKAHFIARRALLLRFQEIFIEKCQ